MRQQTDIPCFRLTEKDYEPTEERPDARTMRHLRRELKALEHLVHLHHPGDGWHYLPVSPRFCHNGAIWFVDRPTSEGAILAHVQDLCTLFHLDLAALLQAAFPDPPFDPLTLINHAACARPATTEDVAAVLEDLTIVNYHRLRELLEEALPDKKGE